MQEHWIKWHPNNAIGKKYFIESVINNSEGLTISMFDMQNEEEKTTVFFDYPIEAFRFADESYRIKLAEQLFAIHGAGFYGNWTFFKVNNSELSKWVKEQASHTADDLLFNHFSFIADNAVLDVVTTGEPTIIMK